MFGSVNLRLHFAVLVPCMCLLCHRAMIPCFLGGMSVASACLLFFLGVSSHVLQVDLSGGGL